MNLPPTPKHHIAILISRIFNPLLIVVPTMVLAMIGKGEAFTSSLLWTAVAVGIVNLPMLAWVQAGIRSGRYSDFSVSIREQRHNLYLIGGISLVILATVLLVFHAPRVLVACLFAAILATLIGFLINRRTKISLHAAGMGGCTAVLLITMPTIGFILLAASPFVGWSRIHLKHHTILQFILGWMVAASNVWIVFEIAGLR